MLLYWYGLPLLHVPCTFYRPLLPGLPLPRSYNHRLFKATLVPLPVEGLGGLGAPRTLSSLPLPPGPNGDGEP